MSTEHGIQKKAKWSAAKIVSIGKNLLNKTDINTQVNAQEMKGRIWKNVQY